MSFISGNTGNFIGAATGALINLSHSREDESEADCIGIAMLNKANIRADGLLEFFERMGSEGGTAAASTQRKNARQPGLLAFFSTHPSDAARTAAIRRMAYGTGNALAANEWQALKTICGTTEDGQDDPLFRLFR
jgi:predicted Zn-dependent protease